MGVSPESGKKVWARARARALGCETIKYSQILGGVHSWYMVFETGRVTSLITPPPFTHTHTHKYLPVAVTMEC